ncbi:hypothetical protein KHA94_10530 [Bacillus sp. FJAT-49705]|uniref:Permuted papain-like amidase YaeF/Yiix C92 family enzyme n=1 Tax=Cytobacillus citreus TaxID=2833586 RepID=A0ABS5NS36_9BACI|nr:hypothetical protein [Cytobacillus citreus]MBS4190618.1 hypothetical protein [Cytobacillus citreus]
MGDKKIYLIFTDTGTLFTKLIKLYTKKAMNHVSISFDDQLNEIFSFGRKKRYNPFIGGFVREKIAAGLFKKAKCEIYSIAISESEYEQMQVKVRQIEAKKDFYKYNLLGIFAIILNYNLKRENAYFCSQFVATILNEKKELLCKSPSLCTPQDLMGIYGLQFIYKGDIILFPLHANKEIDSELTFSNYFMCNTVDFS